MAGIPCLFCFSTEPPQEVKTKSSTSGAVYGQVVDLVERPNTFQISLGEAPCKAPGCCCISFLCAPHGCTACWARNETLKVLSNGIEDYECCQGYINCCCIKPGMCRGSMPGLIAEGCCCPVLSLSITRLFIMDKLDIHPDPGDYQLIRFSNCLQVVSCVFNVLAIFIDALRDAAQILDCIADCVTFSIAGCMGAQINAELEKYKKDVESGVSPSNIAVTEEPVVATIVRD